MPRKSPKTKTVAFKVEEELAEFLDKLENKSDFIRRAILAQFSMACPLCSGSGVVSRGIHDHYAPLLNQNNTRPCDNCHSIQPVPSDINSVSEVDRARYEQFFHGGPLLCVACYQEAPACTKCRWHITPQQFPEHDRTAHA